MKFYDKEIYQKSEAINSVVIILIIFIISFSLGFWSCSFEKEKIIKQKQTKIDEQFIEIDCLRETVHMYQIYENKKE